MQDYCNKSSAAFAVSSYVFWRKQIPDPLVKARDHKSINSCISSLNCQM